MQLPTTLPPTSKLTKHFALYLFTELLQHNPSSEILQFTYKHYYHPCIHRIITKIQTYTTNSPQGVTYYHYSTQTHKLISMIFTICANESITIEPNQYQFTI